ncbi:MAG: alpha/beta hydrolase [Gemmataceae bacterium]
MKTRGHLLVLVGLVALPIQLFCQEKTPGKRPVTVLKDLAFGKGGDRELQLDLAMPKDATEKTPAILCLHGGGWRAGNRKDLSKLIEVYAEKGFVAATASYRLSSVSPFPAQIEDCKAAVRWLRANADKYHIDPNRIGTVGFSAGAHLACLLGTAGADAELEGKGGSPGQSSKVQAVVSFFGPTDFSVKRWDKSVEDYFLKPFFGGSYEDKKDLYCRASPARYVSKDCPPFLFFHGDKDRLVNIEESRHLCKKLDEAGVSARLVTMENEGHGWSGEKLTRSLDQSAAFFAEKLKK